MRSVFVEALAQPVLEMGLAVLAAALFFRLLCAAPLAALAVLALVGLALQEGLMPVPESALAERIDAAQTEVHRGERDRAAAISCQVAAFDALVSERPLASAGERCRTR